MTYTTDDIAGRIQHTEVTPTADRERIDELCDECLEYGFDGAMVQPCWVPHVAERLADSEVTVCTAVGFPMGGDRPLTKAVAIRDAVAAGAEEIDVMPNIGFVRSGNDQAVREELETIVDAAGDATVKIMLELAALSPERREFLTQAAVDAGFDYIKNSSGWGAGGKADVETVSFLSEYATPETKVKASGGIKTFEDAVELLEAGAELLGASSGVEIVTGEVGEGEY
ncbi:deoxyribose-phosphate aldolase [Natrialbaceae archaeon A-CW2]|uniref:deoxyribose-phosphate aldolase n=1 Tax=Natronosalvus amylolyticus TaxID=2961994 RepID=UPI0020C94B4A|nr:deoxyribose-phosphate aldolase [Natronosalvus amylolyticus]